MATVLGIFGTDPAIPGPANTNTPRASLYSGILSTPTRLNLPHLLNVDSMSLPHDQGQDGDTIDPAIRAQVIALQEELAVTQKLLKDARATAKELLDRDGGEQSVHPEVRAAARALASLDAPTPLKIQIEVEEARLKHNLAEFALKQAHARKLEAGNPKMEAINRKTEADIRELEADIKASKWP